MWLARQEYSRGLIKKYVDSGWIKKYGRGAFVRIHDTVSWSSAVWGVQKTHNVYVGGKTALQLQGKAHFVQFQDQRIFLFSKSNVSVPLWLKNKTKELNLVSISTDIFPGLMGKTQYDFGGYSIWVSNIAQAFLEYMYLTPKYHSYEEAYQLMENLHFIPAHLMQEALKTCHSIKIKRLVLCLAKIQNASWYKSLDLQKIELGKGQRHHIIDGVWDSEYKIYYPSDWKKNESPIFLINQTNLLLNILGNILPLDSSFILKGETSINFIWQNLPRISVDLDLTYKETGSRDDFFKS